MYAQSEFGAFLDPVADKLIVCASLVLLTSTMGPPVCIPTIIIISREISISALRECAEPDRSHRAIKHETQGVSNDGCQEIVITAAQVDGSQRQSRASGCWMVGQSQDDLSDGVVATAPHRATRHASCPHESFPLLECRPACSCL